MHGALRPAALGSGVKPPGVTANANRRKNFHQKTTKFVGKHRLTVSDDQSIDNMTASANGTAEKPGKNIKQKAGARSWTL
jgi:hypothetical protein